MKTDLLFQFCILVAATAMIAGCGPSSGATASVSGTVTIDGKPAPGVDVVFSPLPLADNASPGPWSHGLTDDKGHYELKTRYGKKGAFIGRHMATFSYPDFDPEEMEELAEELDEAETNEEAMAIRAAIDKAKNALSGRAKIPANASNDGISFNVSADGHSDANFELNQ